MGVEEVGKPRESQHLPVSFASDSSQRPPHNTGPQPFTARTGGWCQRCRLVVMETQARRSCWQRSMEVSVLDSTPP